MSLQTFFLESQVLAEEGAETFELRLSDDDLRHFGVLRLRAGEHVAIVDAGSDYFECEVVEAGRGLPVVRIAKRRDVKRPAFRLALFQGIPKGDKMDEIVRHGTEVGADAFVPVAFERCVTKLDGAKAERRQARWQAIAKSAAMQSGRTSIPEVDAPRSLGDACALMATFDRVIVFWEAADGSSRSVQGVRGALGGGRPQSVAVVVGPEGGISPREVDGLLASCENVRVATLGANILRTETAGVVGCALVAYELGGLGNEGAEGL